MISSSHLGARALGGLAFLLGCGWLPSGGAQAATFTVSSLSDSGPGTLRQAIVEANALAGADTISLSVAGTITLESALPNLSAVTIKGLSSAQSVVARKAGAATKFRIFTVPSDTSVTLLELTITGGRALELGGGVHNRGTLVLTNCKFTNNAAGMDGGALSNFHGKVNANNCQFVGNGAVGSGGAIVNDGRVGENGTTLGPATLGLGNCTLIENTASVNGGGVANYNGLFSIERGSLERNKATASGGGFYTSENVANIIASTLAGNTANEGGGFYSFSETKLNNCTLVENSAVRRGGGLSNAGRFTLLQSCTLTRNKAPEGQGAGAASVGREGQTTTRLVNTIISGNIKSSGAVGSDVDYDGNPNSFATLGYNLVGTGNATAAFNLSSDRVGITNPMLGSLSSNGGPTKTLPLLAGSPALNKGETTLTIDQRGIARPQGGADDVGAFEAVPVVNSAPRLVKLTSPRGTVAEASGEPPTVSPLLNGESPVNDFVTFTSVVRDANGNGDFAYVYLVVGTGENRLRIEYNAVKNLLTVAGPVNESDSFAPGSDRVLTVSTGALDCAGTTVTRSGTDITIAWRFKITSTSAVKNELRMVAEDKAGVRSAALSFGNWTFTNNVAPHLVSVKAPNGTTSTASGSPQTVSPLLSGQSPANSYVLFTTTVRDGNGNADLSKVSFLLGSDNTQLYLNYNAADNLLSITGPTGTSDSFAPGTARVLTVSTGALDCAGTTVTRIENSIQIVWKLKVTATNETVTRALRLRAQDKAGALSALLSFGNWTFTPSTTQAAEAQAASSPSGASS